MTRSRRYLAMLAMVASPFALASQSTPAEAARHRGSPTPMEQSTLQRSLNDLARRAMPGLLGVEVLDLQNSIEARVNANHAYPMMSVFKLPVAAAILSQVDRGRLTLSQKITLHRADVESGSAVPSIGAHFVGEHMTFTIDQLLTAAVRDSDNTAADALVKLAGGPKVVTAFLQSHGIEGMRVDVDEAGAQQIFEGLRAGEKIPSNESAGQAQQRYQRGYRAYLSDPRNRSTPDAAVEFLRKLLSDQLLSPPSSRKLIELARNQKIPSRLRSGLPGNIRLADKCGTSYPLDGETAAYNDIGIITGRDGHSVIVAAFLTASHAPKSERDALFADLGRTLAATIQPTAKIGNAAAGQLQTAH